MKTFNKISKVLKLVGLVTMTLMLANCAKDKNNNTVQTVGGYQLINNTCYQTINGTRQVVNQALCNGVGSYIMQGNICYMVVNGQYIQQPNTMACNNSMYNGYNTGYNTGYNNGNVIVQYCSGPHTDGATTVNCGVNFNCSGYTLYNSNTGQTVRCQ